MLFDRRKTLPQVSQDLLAIADYIREHGWCQGTLVNAQGKVCLLGAAQITNDEWDSQRWGPLIRSIQQANGNKSVMLWNDAPGRTVEEVLDLLERLAWEGQS